MKKLLLGLVAAAMTRVCVAVPGVGRMPLLGGGRRAVLVAGVMTCVSRLTQLLLLQARLVGRGVVGVVRVVVPVCHRYHLPRRDMRTAARAAALDGRAAEGLCPTDATGRARLQFRRRPGCA